jgi:hypothetical protein
VATGGRNQSAVAGISRLWPGSTSSPQGRGNPVQAAAKKRRVRAGLSRPDLIEARADDGCGGSWRQWLQGHAVAAVGAEAREEGRGTEPRRRRRSPVARIGREAATVARIDLFLERRRGVVSFHRIPRS